MKHIFVTCAFSVISPFYLRTEAHWCVEFSGVELAAPMKKVMIGLGGGLRGPGELLRCPRDRARAVLLASGTRGGGGNSGGRVPCPRRGAPTLEKATTSGNRVREGYDERQPR